MYSLIVAVCFYLIFNLRLTSYIAEHFGLFNSSNSSAKLNGTSILFNPNFGSVDFAKVLIFMRLIINRVHNDFRKSSIPFTVIFAGCLNFTLSQLSM